MKFKKMKTKRTLKIALAIMIIAIIIAILVIIYFPAPDILTGNPIDDILIGIIVLPIAIITIVITFFVFIIAFLKLLRKANKQTTESENISEAIEVKNEKAEETLLLDKASYEENVAEKTKTSICEICGAEAHGYRHCKKCYKQQIKAKKQKNKYYKTKNGDIVKSKSELIIYEYLLDNNYKFVYEAELKLYNEFNELITVHPDFCIRINEKTVFVEYWGYDETNVEYTKTKNKKLKLYSLNNVPLINICEKEDGEQVREVLEKKLADFLKNQTTGDNLSPVEN